MKPGDLVRFISSFTEDQGIGLVVRDYDVRQKYGARPVGYYYVLTGGGMKIVGEEYMEKIG